MPSLTVRDPLPTGPVAATFGRCFSDQRSSSAAILTGWWPPMDVGESDDGYTIYMDVPGVRGEDVTVEVDDGVLTMSGARASAPDVDPLRAERPVGSFVRTLTLPKGVDGDQIVADCRNGVLQLHIPKSVHKTTKTIPLEVPLRRRSKSRTW